MGIAILVIMGAAAAFGVFSYLTLSRGGRQHPRHVRGVRGHDATQYGALWAGDSGGWGGGHSGGWGGFDGGGGGGSCGDGGGGGGSC